ncbi:L-serine ammonia-lyase [Corynebacterium diphtheriae]|nr:L-serine ammonia-lyase [Corynebacterium diphtheriae]
MSISVTDLFSIGIGPSSSHTVGPLRAAEAFLSANNCPDDSEIAITLHGSLAATGIGHGTDRAAILGLAGYTPITLTPDVKPVFGSAIPTQGTVSGPRGEVRYRLIFDPVPLPEHPNAMTFVVYGPDGNRIGTPAIYYSIGGGFIATADTMREQKTPESAVKSANQDLMPYPFTTGDELLYQCQSNALSIPQLMEANETAIHGSILPVNDHLDSVWATMQECVNQGLSTWGILPGGLEVERRAPQLFQHLTDGPVDTDDALRAMEWVNLFALAVNEENAAGGRVVTAPTNGAAGIVPAVLQYAEKFVPQFTETSHRDFLLTAAAIGIIIKYNASISGAEVGCQGEVGSASSMAAAGLCQVLNGTPRQVEHAAEIALEHNLGLTCDPVGGLVQIPCIERNAIGAVKSINAARLSLIGSGKHRVRLDDAVLTMAETGRDMLTKYKETSTGGLAIRLGLPVSITEC